MTKHLYVEGNTYPVRDILKGLGCKWDCASDE